MGNEWTQWRARKWWQAGAGLGQSFGADEASFCRAAWMESELLQWSVSKCGLRDPVANGNVQAANARRRVDWKVAS